ncbi:NAD(P)-dependent oxidoreductase [Sphingobium limneticum]|uniref:NAD(P)-dependent oxidoreductase n=1 Tax=Sphingobium limneticum TaxID=1007511 RepID=A0A5J5HZ10_9SPHN|nr:NAD(P)-dependent oxidoreductase [Sphingobium limneticum]KAA9015844.1 NAD(P)-dependent oxidoreductase [Sphingobium limneticum]KAA9028257.1 NAD(P)-dependent oxidoreductase [Sphingobium limneticum]
MKVAIIGGTGRAGTEISAELARRGHQVTAISRHPENAVKVDGVTAVARDVQHTDALVEAIKGHDVVVSAVMFSDTDPTSLVGVVRDSGVPRYLVVGGAGSLEVAPGVALITTPEFPEAYKAEAGKGADFLTYLRGVDDIDWTFLSPSAYFFVGDRKGSFRLGKDELLADADGNSSISYADYAIALVDEIETPKHSKARFTVGY